MLSPSGSALAMMVAAIVPPAPARFSTITVWPRYSASFLCITRATVSVPPPGAKPTVTVTGRAGYVCAVAFETRASAAAIAQMSLILFSFSRVPLFSLEYGLALLHEGSAAFDVILALEALLHECGAGFRVVRARLQQLAHDALARADGERRVLGDHRAVLEDQCFELGDRRHAMHEAHGLRLLGLELAPGDQHFSRERRADGVDQVLERAGAVAQSQLRGGDAHAGVIRRDAQVAAQGDVDPRPEAVAADHGDDHLVAGLQALGYASGDLLVALDALCGRTVLLVLRYIRPGNEGLVALALEHDHADLGVLLEAVEHLGYRFPHVDRDGVPARGVVEGEPADRALLLGDDALGELARREGGLFRKGDEFCLIHVHSCGESAIVSRDAAARPLTAVNKVARRTGRGAGGGTRGTPRARSAPFSSRSPRNGTGFVLGRSPRTENWTSRTRSAASLPPGSGSSGRR